MLFVSSCGVASDSVAAPADRYPDIQAEWGLMRRVASAHMVLDRSWLLRQHCWLLGLLLLLDRVSRLLSLLMLLVVLSASPALVAAPLVPTGCDCCCMSQCCCCTSVSSCCCCCVEFACASMLSCRCCRHSFSQAEGGTCRHQHTTRAHKHTQQAHVKVNKQAGFAQQNNTQLDVTAPVSAASHPHNPQHTSWSCNFSCPPSPTHLHTNTSHPTYTYKHLPPLTPPLTHSPAPVQGVHRPPGTSPSAAAECPATAAAQPAAATTRAANYWGCHQHQHH